MEKIRIRDKHPGSATLLDVVGNLFGSGGLQVTVSSSIDPFPPWDPKPAT